MALPDLADIARISHVRLPDEPPCPEVPEGHTPVFLLDAATGLEDRLLRAWIDRCGLEAVSALNLAPSRIRRRTHRSDYRMADFLTSDEPVWLIPLRVAWMPTERHGRRSVSWLDVLKLGDPRDPRWYRDYVILARRPDRVRIVVGAGAGGGELTAAHRDSVEHYGLVEFVTRRAWRALDRAERAERGDRYKISRFVAEDLVNRPDFRDEVISLGRKKGLPEPVALARARYYVSEIAATHSPYLIDLIANLIHWVIRQGYGAIHYDRRAIEHVARLGRDNPLVFLPSHKSNLDRLSLQFMLWENDLPPNHTAGGINMNFFPVGPLVRRTGVFYIRRSFKGNDLYKFVLRTYLDYLIEKRFPLEWYMEGGRSRSGKLRPPRYGMLSWVVDSYLRGKSDDIYLLPISIAYDQIQEVGAYVREATGGSKDEETFSWAVKFARSLRRRYGDIHIRFADPVSIASEMEGANLTDDNPIEVQKLAFEVMYRISRVTPITPTALVSTVFLATKDGAHHIDTITAACDELVRYVTRYQLPTTTELPRTSDDVEGTMALMAEHGLISSHSAAGRTVYWMDADQRMRASYYSSAVEHFFVPRSLAEIALAAPDLEGFWTDLFDLRDLLKFEFFFADKDEFRRAIAEELASEVPDWEDRVAAGDGGSVALKPSTVGWSVLPLLEGYLVVADELHALEGPVEDEEALLSACLERGRLYRLEGRIQSDESVSRVVFGGALLLAKNRGLTTNGVDMAKYRAELAAQIVRYIEAACRRLPVGV